jgi:hypothetical protein
MFLQNAWSHPPYKLQLQPTFKLVLLFGKKSTLPTERRLCGPQRWSEGDGNENNSSIISHPARSQLLYTDCVSPSHFLNSVCLLGHHEHCSTWDPPSDLICGSEPLTFRYRYCCSSQELELRNTPAVLFSAACHELKVSRHMKHFC